MGVKEGSADAGLSLVCCEMLLSKKEVMKMQVMYSMETGHSVYHIHPWPLLFYVCMIQALIQGLSRISDPVHYFSIHQCYLIESLIVHLLASLYSQMHHSMFIWIEFPSAISQPISPTHQYHFVA